MTIADSATDVPGNLKELEIQLQSLSHDDQPVKLIKDFAIRIRNTKQRQSVFNTKGALVREPIIYQDVLARGLIDSDEKPFTLLQGDIVSTDAAYFLGERVTGSKFVVASSTCDLIKNRRQYAALLRIQPIRKDDPKAEELISQLLRFSSTQRMYLPLLPDDPIDALANAVSFDGIVQVRLEQLLLATRYASLSLVGWRIFGSLVRSIMVRAEPSEVKMRSSI